MMALASMKFVMALNKEAGTLLAIYLLDSDQVASRAGIGGV